MQVPRTVFIALCAAALTGPVRAQRPQSPPPPPVTKDTLERWLKQVSNAGRWGAGDELGTLNLITPARRREAAALVRTGETVSLAAELVPGPDPRALRPLTMQFHTAQLDSVMVWGFDSTAVVVHGWAYSHLDALSHASWRGRMYNGFDIRDSDITGARRLGMQVMANGIVGRGILIDVPRLHGVPWLEPATMITVADLEAWEKRSGVRVGQGDIVMIRTGRWARERRQGAWDLTKGAAGPHPSVALWLHARGAAALGGDASSEFYPSVVAGISEPLHALTITAMGMPLLDNLDLEAVAERAAANGRWAFLFTVAPPRIRGAAGALVNPLAIF